MSAAKLQAVQVMIDRDGGPHHRRCGYLFDVTFRYSTHQRSFAGLAKGALGGFGLCFSPTPRTAIIWL